MEFALGLFALAYSGLVLFALANAMRKLYPPRRAALTAFAVSAIVHAVTTLFLNPEHRLLAVGFWGIPHLLILPLLLAAARRQPPSPGP